MPCGPPLKARPGCARGRTDVQTSLIFLSYARDVHSWVLVLGSWDRARFSATSCQTCHRRGPPEPFAGFVQANPNEDPAKQAPRAPEFPRLTDAKLRLVDLIDRGGHGPTVPVGSPAPGATRAGLGQLRDRLVAMGYPERPATDAFDVRVQQAVVKVRVDHGRTAVGMRAATRSAP